MRFSAAPAADLKRLCTGTGWKMAGVKARILAGLEGYEVNDRNTEVMEKYELEIRALRRGRGAWICETDQGLKLLREYKGTVKRLEFEEAVLGVLGEDGNFLVDQYVRNRENELLTVAEDGCRYIVKDWFADRECNVQSEEETVRAVTQIAGLHRLLRTVEVKEEWNLGSILSEPVVCEMERHNRELCRARNFIRKKRKKSDFEICVTGNFCDFYEQAKAAHDGLEEMLREDGAPKQYLCHGELNQHHILIGQGYVAIIEFNRMHLGVQIADLYHFIRKIMEKHGWELQLGMRLLEAYDRVLPMGKGERRFLYYLFLYPEKYWKQLNFYFNAGKAWIPARNVEKLKGLEQQQRAREQFLRAIEQ